MNWPATAWLVLMSAVGGGLTAPPPAASGDTLLLRWTSEPGSAARAELVGLKPDEVTQLRAGGLERLQKLLAIYAEPAEGLGDLKGLAMAGTYELTDESLRFQPSFALTPGMRYRAVARLAQLPGARREATRLLAAVHRVPARETKSTTVVSRVYPSAAEVPENLLKFYVYFSAPMSRGHVYEHIQLLTQEGPEVELPFLQIDEELWDPQMQRLTLFFDPGRIKREVQPLEEIGPALVQGKRYTLVLGPGLEDAQGAPLQTGFRKEFRAGPPDRQPPDPGRWKIASPRSGTRQPMTVDFGEALDQALARRLISLSDAKGGSIMGNVELGRQETSWSFVPDQNWVSGAYTLTVGGVVEDLAGNSVGRPFEVDIFEGVERKIPQERVILPVQIE